MPTLLFWIAGCLGVGRGIGDAFAGKPLEVVLVPLACAALLFLAAITYKVLCK